MTRPTRISLDLSALLHNLACVRMHAPNKKIMAMVKANAYGCGVSAIAPVLAEHVDAFGVASLAEALAIRALGLTTDCVLMQGLFSLDELFDASTHGFHCVIHTQQHIDWILQHTLSRPLRVWIKVNTGLGRLGFEPDFVLDVVNQLSACPSVNADMGLLTHLAHADDPSHPFNHVQYQKMLEVRDLCSSHAKLTISLAGSGAILAFPEMQFDVVRPGIMLYGVSPHALTSADRLGLKPVMHFMSDIIAIHHLPPDTSIGYGHIWQSDKPAVIGIIAAGYGDGYPRHIAPCTFVWVKGYRVPIVGRVAMDLMTIDLTDCLDVFVGDTVELWGAHISVDEVARSAGTSPYELLCQITPRVQVVNHN